MFRPFAMTAAVALVAALGGVALADRHHDGHARIKGTQNGHVHLGTTKHGHAPHANVKNGKVAGLVVHKNGKDVTDRVSTKKVKTQNKKHLTDAGANVDEDTDLNAIWFVGYAFYCPFDNEWVVFWFPVGVVDGGLDGADEI
ncbi:MAG: hypothetical protein JWO38_3247 [Gemmataceae bacterium]|nr:hypothetical protein [Gemmataceae bacterium]